MDFQFGAIAKGRWRQVRRACIAGCLLILLATLRGGGAGCWGERQGAECAGGGAGTGCRPGGMTGPASGAGPVTGAGSTTGGGAAGAGTGSNGNTPYPGAAGAPELVVVRW